MTKVKFKTIIKISEKIKSHVEKEHVLPGSVTVDGVKNGGHIHKQPCKDLPKILDIPEENKQRRQDQSRTDIKQDQAQNRINKANELPGKSNMIQYAEHKKNDQGKSKVDKRLDVFREQKQIFGNVNLGEYFGVFHQRLHALHGCIVKIGEHKISTK